ncbi:MAG: phosphotransferase [Thermoleophilaceae bacterium]
MDEPRALTGAAAARLVRKALESGDANRLAAAYARDALLDASVAGGRSVDRGGDAIAARLERLWPGRGRLVEWTATPGSTGCAIWAERVAEDGYAIRQRQYLQIRDGAIGRHWVFGAPPRTRAPELGGAEAPPLFDRLGVTKRQPLVSTGWSGNRLERLHTADGRILIAKRVDPSGDWIGRNSADRGREGLLYTEGLFERMSGIDPAVVAAEPDDGAWWVVTRDVSDTLLDARSPISREQNRLLLRAANSMWEEFWGERHDFLCGLGPRIALTGPAVAERERDRTDLLPKQFEAAWEAFGEAVPGDVAEPVLALLDDPSPIVAELDSYGSTLLHGDIRDEQIGFADQRVIVLDWGVATQGHPVVDLAWYMVHDMWRIDATHDEVVDDFRRARGDHDDGRAVDLLGLLGLLLYGWIFGICAVIHTDAGERAWAQEELDWWVPMARRSLER